MIARLTNPATYTGLWSSMLKKYTPLVRAGGFMPVIHLMMAVGTIGYVVEWTALGRHHVAHKNHEIEHALAEYRAKNHDHGGDDAAAKDEAPIDVESEQYAVRACIQYLQRQGITELSK
ncbi:hypothetical protein ScalyP_jg1344 [Parmales sp. scaly parma]|nr:hypothetical protein ScalyP_jg1344 [Parmales sp. scaly parma]